MCHPTGLTKECMTSFMLDTISQLHNPAGLWNCLRMTISPFLLLKHGSLFYFPTLLSLTISGRQRKRASNYPIRFSAQALDPFTSIWLPLIDAQQGLSSKTAKRWLPFIVVIWENKSRISLSSTIRTGAIKGSSLLLWSFDLYQGIHKQKLDAYCGCRARPGSYQKHSGEMACLTGIIFSPHIPVGWVLEMKCTGGISSCPCSGIV